MGILATLDDRRPSLAGGALAAVAVAVMVGATLAGTVPSAPAAGVLIMSGVVWYDDGDGIREAGEAPAPDYEVSLSKCEDDGVNNGNDALAWQRTDADGRYAFHVQGVARESYCLRVHMYPAELVPTRFRSEGSTWATDSDVNPRHVYGYQAYSPPVRLADPLARRSAMDIGLVARDLSPCYISGEVWADTDTDGKMEEAEPRTEGFEVGLLDGSGNRIATTTTDRDGFYVFNRLPQAIYAVEFDLAGRPAGTTFTRRLDSPASLQYNYADIASWVVPATIAGDPPTATTRPSSACTRYATHAGIAAPDPGTDRRISGNATRDRNGDGIRNNDPGLAGVVVRLYRQNDGVLVATKVTGLTGNYTFGKLPLGWYVVEFDLSRHPGATFSTPASCCFGATYTDVDPTTIQTGPARGRSQPQFVGNDPDVVGHIDASVLKPAN